MDGIIVVNKPKGFTSHDIVNKIRKIYNTKKVGHTGTLDPEATGVLPILIGNATKLSNYLMEHDKEYIATIRLGERTNTGDSEGEVIETKDVPEISSSDLDKTVKLFIGKQIQTPPIYSAIKVNGKKLYEYARSGEKVEIPKREVEIYNINIEKFEFPEITFNVSCSKGTYIRTLCEDIAKKLGTIGYMKDLQRTKVNKFSIENSYTIEQIEKDKDNVKLVSIEEVLQDNENVILDDSKLTLFLNGGRIKVKNSNGIVKVYNKNVFIGTGTVQNNILKRDIVINK